jgi:hypothetical protein
VTLLLEGPHYSFDIRTELVAYPVGNVYHAKLPHLGLMAIGEPSESRGAVVHALGDAVCEIWCTLVCLAQDQDTEWAACLTHEDRQLGLTLVRLLVEVRTVMGASGSHSVGRLRVKGLRPGEPLRQRELTQLVKVLEHRLRGHGIFGA